MDNDENSSTLLDDSASERILTTNI